MAAKQRKIAIVGGGAAGFFAAIQCAEQAKASGKKVAIAIFESNPSFLRKVAISGGGRCNITFHNFKTREFVESYPRGSRELLSPLQQFQAENTVEWFHRMGVKTKVEADGRIFPISDDSASVVDCLIARAKKLGVECCAQHAVKNIRKIDSGKFIIDLKCTDFLAKGFINYIHKANKNEENSTDGSKMSINQDSEKNIVQVEVDSVLIATGSAKPAYQWAKDLGHKITDLAPSLFSFKIQSKLLKELPGTSFPKAKLVLRVGKKKFLQEGPVLVTHWGLSGPAILKLSAWAAREMKAEKYKAKLYVNWCAWTNQEFAKDLLQKIKKRQGNSKMQNSHPKELTKRFWLELLKFCGISVDKNWNEASNQEIEKIAKHLLDMEFEVQGQNRFKEEFVECGGVSLKEINFKTMESKICKNLFFAGEILDIDGITGGFNLQNAWTTGWIAGNNL